MIGVGIIAADINNSQKMNEGKVAVQCNSLLFLDLLMNDEDRIKILPKKAIGYYILQILQKL